jgi:lipoprotein NlpI
MARAKVDFPEPDPPAIPTNLGRIASILEAMPRPVLPFLFLLVFCAHATEVEKVTATIESQGGSAALYNRRGEANFRAGSIDAAIADFDRAISLQPNLAPQHWQRGIALYYAGRYEDGYKQFELHQTVNPQDVENGVWHFLCRTQANGIDDARAHMLPISGDPRVPMAEIWRLFQGKGTVEDVFRAVDQGEGQSRADQLFYAHLYVGLYYEALDQGALAGEHIRKAAQAPGAHHYMGDVARVHARMLGL